ncbi:hypothetical protein [Streptomyces sp. NPDC050856]
MTALDAFSQRLLDLERHTALQARDLPEHLPIDGVTFTAPGTGA